MFDSNKHAGKTEQNAVFSFSLFIPCFYFPGGTDFIGIMYSTLFEMKK